MGSWAFRIPALQLDCVGVESGKTSGRFEALAVLNGLEAVHSLDLSATVRVFTDSEEVVVFLSRIVGLSGSATLPAKAAKGKTDLVRRFQDAICDRRVAVTKYSGGGIDHQWCHRSARQALHEAIEHDPVLQHGIATRRVRTKLDSLVRKRAALEKRLCGVEDGISVARLELAALQLAVGRSEIEGGGGTRSETTREIPFDPVDVPDGAGAFPQTQPR
jgi:ribonuclease HI